MRNQDDLECLAAPPKYRDLQTFHKYYSGQAKAPYPTLFSKPQCRSYYLHYMCLPKTCESLRLSKIGKGVMAQHSPTLPAVGGNHEACNYLWELYYGGWAAPNIYYLGHAGVVSFGGVRIGGLSGTYQSHHYHLVRASQATS